MRQARLGVGFTLDQDTNGDGITDARLVDTDDDGKADAVLKAAPVQLTPSKANRVRLNPRVAMYANHSGPRCSSAKTLDPRMRSHRRTQHTGRFASSRARVFRLLERPRSSRTALAFFLLIVISILASSITYGLSTVDSLEDSPALLAVEGLCGVIFTFELGLRIFSTHTMRALLTDATFHVDVLSLLPWWLDVVLWLGGNGAFGSSDLSAIQVCSASAAHKSAA